MTGKIKILQLGSPTGLYGAERWILALIRHLDPNKFESLVAAIKDDSSLEVPLCAEASKLGFKTHIFHIKGRFNLSAISMLRNFILKNDIQILHTHAYKQDIIGFASTLGTDCKLVTTPHGWSKEPDFKLWFYEMFNRVVFPFFDAVVPLSDELYRPLRYLPGMKGKLHLIRNGVDISEIDSVTELAPEVVSFKKEGVFVIGYIGQLIHRKGIDVSLEAVTALPESLNWRLVVVGEGNQRKALEEKATKLGLNEHVNFLGFRKDRIALLKGFHVFVLPSRLEGIPRCLMEAMAAGVPVIASDIPGCNSLLKYGKTGMLFPVDNAGSLAKRIKEVASDKTLRASLSKAARQLVEQDFSAKRMAKEYESLYLSISHTESTESTAF